MKKNMTIIGGGISGIYLSILLKKYLDIDVLVLEAGSLTATCHFCTPRIAQNADYINVFEFFYCQISLNLCSIVG